jgi:hypothetical protein
MCSAVCIGGGGSPFAVQCAVRGRGGEGPVTGTACLFGTVTTGRNAAKGGQAGCCLDLLAMQRGAPGWGSHTLKPYFMLSLSLYSAAQHLV